MWPRRLGLCVVGLAAGCAFDPTGLPPGTTSDGRPADPDAAVVAIDAPVTPVIDAPGPCPDDDGDGVCNATDRCPGSNDTVDHDGDGNPDGCDDWDCGPTRPSINLPVSTGGSINAAIELWSFNFGPNVIELSPGATVGFGDTVALRDDNNGCGNCNDQVEVGFAGGARFQCVDFGNPQQGVTQRQIRTGTITAPSTPGRHDVVIKVAQAGNCNSDGSTRVNGWWPPAPTSPIVAAVCVR